MIVRPVELADVNGILALARVNVSESRFRNLPFHEAKVQGNVVRMISQPRTDHFFCGAFTSDKRLAGYMVGSIEAYFFCDRTVATSVFLFVSPDQRGGAAAVKLILAFRAWAKNRRATELYIGVAGGVLTEKTGQFLQRMGLKFTGGNYSAWLDSPGHSEQLPATQTH